MILEKVNNLLYKVQEDDLDILKDLNSYFAIKIPGSEFIPAVKAGRWDGKKRFFDIQRRTLPIGLLGEIINYCKVRKLPIKLQDKEKHLGEDYQTCDVVDLFKQISSEDFEPRDYQVSAIKAAIKAKNLSLVSPTGSGKSYMIYGLIRYLMMKVKKILLIVPSTNLVEQMYSDFESYGWSDLNFYVSKLYSGQLPNYNHPVLISTWQSLQKKEPEFFQEFEAVIVDEMHGASADVLTKICQMCFFAEYRYGFTGTIPPDRFSNYSAISYIGPPLQITTTFKLIEEGSLSQMKVINYLVVYPENERKQNCSRGYQDEIRFVEEHAGRNKIWLDIFKKIPQKENSLILLNHLAHIEKVKEYIEKNLLDRKVFTITGSVETAEREITRKLTDSSEGIIIVASYGTMAVGVNIKNLSNIIFGSSTKSWVRCLQSIGRGLRLHPNKDGMIVWDICDYLAYKKTEKQGLKTNHLLRHATARKKIYEAQQFKVEQMDYYI